MKAIDTLLAKPFVNRMGIRPFVIDKQLVDLVQAIARKHGLCPQDLVGRSRARRYSWPRQELYYAAHKGRGITQEAVAEMLGVDHSTVSYGCKEHQARMEARG